jgi:hypothetical protein
MMQKDFIVFVDKQEDDSNHDFEKLKRNGM